MKSPSVLLALLPTLCPAATPHAEFARGLLAELRGDGEAAKASFESALAADPSALPLARRVASYRLADNDLAGAVATYRKVVETTPDRLEATLEYADFLRGNFPADDSMSVQVACEALEKALARHPAQPSLTSRLFRAYKVRHMDDKARGMFDITSARAADAPEAALAANDMARVLLDPTNPADRQVNDGIFESAMTGHPENPALAQAAAEYFRNTKRPELAISMLSAHAKANPSSLDLRTRLGILQLAANHPDDGEATLKEILAIDPNRALAHQTLAKFYRKQSNPAAARFHASELLKLRGGDPDEYLTLADEWLAADAPRDARILLEKASFRHPDNAAIAAKLAIATRRDPTTRDRAPRLFREAEALSANDPATRTPDFIAASADAFLEAGQSPAAEQRLRDAIRAFPPEAKKETAAALRRLAALWEKEHRNAEATRSLKARADAIDPK